jgi:peptidylprolyl isomerase
VGQQFQMSDEEGHIMVVAVIKVTDEKVTLDANHPLAGKDLTFELELVSIE